MKNIITFSLMLIVILMELAPPAISETATNMDEAKTVANAETKNILIEFYVDD